jgi:predicted transcriptional regulator
MVATTLGELERAVMDVLWNHAEPMLARDILRALAGRDLAYTTVVTVLDRLARKEFVLRNMDGRAWRYNPAATREAYIAQLMLDALAQTGDRDAALTHFASTVSDPDAQVLGAALRAKPTKP